MKKWLEKTGIMAVNHRGELIPAVAGVIFILGSVFAWSIFRITNIAQIELVDRLIFLSLLIGGSGFIDDISGKKDFQGFKGHFSQLLRGRLTTGAFKAIISFMAVVFVLVVVDKEKSLPAVLTDLSLILLLTNFFNLLDLRPGRAIKFFLLLSGIILLILPIFWMYFLPLYLIIILYINFELQGKVMLGDTGANFLGVTAGFTLSQWPSLNGKMVVTLILLILTALSEKYSFTEYIARNRVLNWLDQLGRRN